MHGRSPTDAEIETWIMNLTDRQLARYISSASELFDDAARTYLAEELATEQNKSFQAKVLTTIEKGSSWKRQLLLALIAIVGAPIILGIVLAALDRYKDFPSILDLF
jgi:hypothetical protein